MTRALPTIADLRAAKGRRQMTMLRLFTLDESEAAEAAGIDIASVPPELLFDPGYRAAAPSVFTMTGLTHLEAGSADNYLRWCGDAVGRGADAVYCSGSLRTVEHLAREHIPVVGHVGLVPSRATWTGGFRAVGRTAEEAVAIWEQVRALETAGAIAAEIEVVPHEVASAIAARTTVLLWSMGAGAGCDAQYLFANDVLGYTVGHVPRHAKFYRNFRAELDRLQAERIAAFREFAADVGGGSFPEERHLVTIPPAELDQFLDRLEAGKPA